MWTIVHTETKLETSYCRRHLENFLIRRHQSTWATHRSTDTSWWNLTAKTKPWNEPRDSDRPGETVCPSSFLEVVSDSWLELHGGCIQRTIPLTPLGGSRVWSIPQGFPSASCDRDGQRKKQTKWNLWTLFSCLLSVGLIDIWEKEGWSWSTAGGQIITVFPYTPDQIQTQSSVEVLMGFCSSVWHLFIGKIIKNLIVNVMVPHVSSCVVNTE